MMALDFRGYGEKLTLEKCSKLHEDFLQILTPLPVQIGVKGRIVISPDQVWVTPWQSKHVLSSTFGGAWKGWRGIPIVVMKAAA